uniref:Uncharacterized protein n=1 Tax=Oryza meridionalis TaxID=40149 RepID=A0A0E0DTS1_9ORYZ
MERGGGGETDGRDFIAGRSRCARQVGAGRREEEERGKAARIRSFPTFACSNRRPPPRRLVARPRSAPRCLPPPPRVPAVGCWIGQY